MLDKIGFGCCIVGALMGLASFIWPDKHLGGPALALFLLGLLLQYLARRSDADADGSIGEAVVDVLSDVDFD
jgi:hypothetical protein